MRPSRPSTSRRRGGAIADDADPSRRLLVAPGDRIVVTRAEHHANLVPWQELAARTGAELRWLDLTGDGRIDPATADVITGRTRVVALTHASNVTGAITPLDAVLPAARAAGALVVLDTCQSAAHLPLDFAALSAAGVDAMVLSGHKMLGPTGIGMLNFVYDQEKCAVYMSNVERRWVKLVTKSIACAQLVRLAPIAGVVFALLLPLRATVSISGNMA